MKKSVVLTYALPHVYAYIRHAHTHIHKEKASSSFRIYFNKYIDPNVTILSYHAVLLHEYCMLLISDILSLQSFQMENCTILIQ